MTSSQKDRTKNNRPLEMDEDRISQLVERFYSHLTEEPYFRTMFTERNVDLNTLKERQKTFILRLIHENTHDTGQDKVEQVQNRHPFHTTAENAKVWMDTMRRTMDEIDLEVEIKELLLTKMQSLMDKITVK